MAVFPEIVPGVPGMFVMLTAKDWGEEVPQVFPAVTVMFPPVEPAVAFIELLVDDPDQPEGKVHVYVVAPETDEML